MKTTEKSDLSFLPIHPLLHFGLFTLFVYVDAHKKIDLWL